ncbi:MAG: hypothetical protein ABIQ18_37450 [Umezawaea sp.]
MKRIPVRRAQDVDLTDQEGLPGPRSEMRLELKPFHFVLSANGPDDSQISRVLAVSIAAVAPSASAALFGFAGQMLTLPVAAVVTMMALAFLGALSVILIALLRPRPAPEPRKGQSG